MYGHYKEAALPLTYRRREVTCLLKPLAMQRSARLAGLSGMGKSNLLRFLVSHPQVLQPTVARPGQPILFLHIDCNRLDPVSPASFYREALFLLRPEGGRPAAIEGESAFRCLAQALRQVAEPILPILVIDRAEQLYEMGGPAFFNQLRNLRDEVRQEMRFILGSQRPLGDLFELEKMFSHICWVGPLTPADWPEFLARHTARLKLTVAEGVAQQVWQVSGGHAGILKNGLEWLNLQQGQPLPAGQAELIEALVTYRPIQNYCRRLWENLTPTEQAFLTHWPPPPVDTAWPELLTASGLVVAGPEGPHLFSPLWGRYLQTHIWAQAPPPPLHLQLEPDRRRVSLTWRGRTATTTISRGLVFELLRVLANPPGQVWRKDDLINAIYPDEKAPEVMEDALFQLVTALRRVLDGLVKKKLNPDFRGSCVQNVRGVGYRLVFDVAGDEGEV